MRRLPQLGGLEAFVIVALRRSLTAASGELNLSVSALSRRIQALESYLNCRLFERRHPELRLTPAGERLMTKIAPLLEQLQSALGEFQPGAGRQLHISVPPAFALGWLLPRLARFQAAHPAVHLSLDTSAPVISRIPIQRLEGTFDGAIVLAPAVGRDIPAVRLRTPSISAVCAPTVLRAHDPGDPAVMIAALPLLVHRDLAVIADLWLAAFGGVQPQRIDYFDTGPVLHEAAANGLGLALGFDESLAGLVESGRLVRPFSLSLVSPLHWFWVCRPEAAAAPGLRKFQAWLEREVADLELPGGSAEDLAETERSWPTAAE